MTHAETQAETEVETKTETDVDVKANTEEDTPAVKQVATKSETKEGTKANARAKSQAGAVTTEQSPCAVVKVLSFGPPGIKYKCPNRVQIYGDACDSCKTKYYHNVPHLGFIDEWGVWRCREVPMEVYVWDWRVRQVDGLTWVGGY